MNIGKLDKQITIQTLDSVKDSYGNQTESWSDLATVWANINYISGQEKELSGSYDTILKVTIAVRYSDALMPPSITDGYRIKYQARDGERYLAVIGARDVKEKRRFIIFDCKDGSNVNAGGISSGITPPSQNQSWFFYATSYTQLPTEATYTGGGGFVLAYQYGATVYYRFVPEPYDPTLDAFYSAFSDPALSGRLAARGAVL